MSDLIPGQITDLSDNPNYKQPDFSKPYMPMKESVDFFSWANVSLESEGTETPKIHYMAIDHALTEETEIQVMMARGLAKSTLFTKFLPLYVAANGGLPNFGRVVTLPIFSATYGQAVNLLKDIKAAWFASDVLSESLSFAIDRNGKQIANKENHICIVNEQGQFTHIVCFGAGEQIRGTKYADEKGTGHRLELMVFDDILKDEILTSVKEREKLVRWYYSSVLPAANPSHNKKIVVGTPMTSDDILMKMLESPEYSSIKIAVAKRMPVEQDKIISAWPTFHTKEGIHKSYNEAKSMGSDSDWFRERMLEVVNNEMRVFKNEWIKMFRYENLKADFGKLNFFTTLDLAVSAKKHGDTSAIMTIGVDEKGNRFLVAIKRGKMTPGEVVDELFSQVKRFNPIETRAEKAALQQVLDYYINQKMVATNIYFNYNALDKNSIDSKEFRIKSMQPLFKMGKMHFPEDVDIDGVDELLYELRGYINTGPTTKYVDCLDALAGFMDPNFIIEPMGYSGSEVHGDMYGELDMEENVDYYDF